MKLFNNSKIIDCSNSMPNLSTKTKFGEIRQNSVMETEDEEEKFSVNSNSSKNSVDDDAFHFNGEYYLHSNALNFCTDDGGGEYVKIVLGIHRLTMQNVVVKTIDKNRFKGTKADYLKWIREQEINILKMIQHENIVRLLQYYETDRKIFIIKEYCSNGSLQQYLDYNNSSTGNDCFRLLKSEKIIIFADLINCLNFIQQRGLYHGAIRPDNILLNQNKQIKLIGFRRWVDHHQHKFLWKNDYDSQYCWYNPPELVMNEIKFYSPTLDVWNCGILLYHLLTETLPSKSVWIEFFENKKQISEIFQTNICNSKNGGDVSVIDSNILLRDDGVLDLIKQMLKIQPMKRIQMKQILKHPWFCVQFGWLGMTTTDAKNTNNNDDDDDDDFCSKQKKQYSEEYDGVIATTKTIAGPLSPLLDDDILNECLRIHGNEVKDIIELRYNILYKYCYQTATYWLIKKNYVHYKQCELMKFLLKHIDHNNCYYQKHQKRPCRNNDGSQMITTATSSSGGDDDYDYDERDYCEDSSNSLHIVDYSPAYSIVKTTMTLPESQVDSEKLETINELIDSPTSSHEDDKVRNLSNIEFNNNNNHDNNSKKLIVSGQQKQNGHSLLSASEESASNYAMSHQSSNLNLLSSSTSSSNHSTSESVGIKEEEQQNSTQKWKNIRKNRCYYVNKIFEDVHNTRISSSSCSNISDDYPKPLQNGNDDFIGEEKINKKNKNNKIKNEKKSLSRKLSFIGTSKKFINSGIINSLWNFQQKCISQNKTNDIITDAITKNKISDIPLQKNKNYNLNHSWKKSFSCDNSPLKNTDSLNRTNSDQWRCDENMVFPSFFFTPETNDSGNYSTKSNQHPETTTPTKNNTKRIDCECPCSDSKKGSSTLIITCYETCQDCIQAAIEILKKKGINFKKEKEKIRCCVAALNTVIMAFQLEFFKINPETFVMIKVKKLRGNSDDFETICNNLRKYFEQKRNVYF